MNRPYLLFTELPPNLSDEFMMSYRHVRPMAEIGGCDWVADAAGQCPPGQWWQLGDILGAMARSPMLSSQIALL